MMDLNIALFPSLDYAAFYVGLGEGIFEKHGLNVNVEHVFTGTGLFSAITSGQKHLATNSLTSGTVGITNNLPIQAISVAAYQETEGNTEVLVLADSDIQTFGDLAGLTVATINLQGLFHLGVMNAVTAEGGDPKTIEALPMSPADEPTALAAGRVDAIVLQDPFLTQAKADFPEFRPLGNPFSTFDFQLPVGVFWSSTETADANPELMRRFREALIRIDGVRQRQSGEAPRSDSRVHRPDCRANRRDHLAGLQHHPRGVRPSQHGTDHARVRMAHVHAELQPDRLDRSGSVT